MSSCAFLVEKEVCITTMIAIIHIADLLSNILSKDFVSFQRNGGVVSAEWLTEAEHYILAAEEMGKAAYDSWKKHEDRKYEDEPAFHTLAILNNVTCMAKQIVNKYCTERGVSGLYPDIAGKAKEGRLPSTLQDAINTFELGSVFERGYLYVSAAEWMTMSTFTHIDTMGGPIGVHKYITPDELECTAQDMTFLTGFSILSLLILSELAFIDQKKGAML